MTPIPQVADAETKQLQLDRMKRRATGLLVLMSVVFVAAWLLEPAHPWLGYVRATAEAGMVGGVADWFAITALFRRPLNLPIPHTAIIPQRKDRIGRSLGNFVQNNFLSPEVLGAKLRAAQLSRRAAEWLQEPEHARSVVRQAAGGAPVGERGGAGRRCARPARAERDRAAQAPADRARARQRPRAAHRQRPASAGPRPPGRGRGPSGDRERRAHP